MFDMKKFIYNFYLLFNLSMVCHRVTLPNYIITNIVGSSERCGNDSAAGRPRSERGRPAPAPRPPRSRHAPATRPPRVRHASGRLVAPRVACEPRSVGRYRAAYPKFTRISSSDPSYKRNDCIARLVPGRAPTASGPTTLHKLI